MCVRYISVEAVELLPRVCASVEWPGGNTENMDLKK